MMKVSNTQINFNGMYAIQGKVEDNLKAYSYIAKKNTANCTVTTYFALNPTKDKLKQCWIILTGQDAYNGESYKPNIKNIIAEKKNFITILSQDLIQKNKIYSFDAEFGFLSKLYNVNWKNFILKVSGNDHYKRYNIIDISFKKPSKLLEILPQLLELEDSEKKNSVPDKKINFGLNDHTIHLIQSLQLSLDKDEYLSTVKVTKIINYKQNVLVLETEQGDVLKIGSRPCYPSKKYEQAFDLPILRRNRVNETSPNAIYYYVQPRALNSNETTITQKIKKEIEQKIISSGYRPWDMTFSQIGLYNGDYFLLDPECARGRPLEH